MKITDITFKNDTRNTDRIGYISFQDKNGIEYIETLLPNIEGGYRFFYEGSFYQLEAVKV